MERIFLHVEHDGKRHVLVDQNGRVLHGVHELTITQVFGEPTCLNISMLEMDGNGKPKRG